MARRAGLGQPLWKLGLCADPVAAAPIGVAAEGEFCWVKQPPDGACGGAVYVDGACVDADLGPAGERLGCGLVAYGDSGELLAAAWCRPPRWVCGALGGRALGHSSGGPG